jgi:hypothetical protein
LIISLDKKEEHPLSKLLETVRSEQRNAKRKRTSLKSFVSLQRHSMFEISVAFYLEEMPPLS